MTLNSFQNISNSDDVTQKVGKAYKLFSLLKFYIHFCKGRFCYVLSISSKNVVTESLYKLLRILSWYWMFLPVSSQKLSKTRRLQNSCVSPKLFRRASQWNHLVAWVSSWWGQYWEHYGAFKTLCSLFVRFCWTTILSKIEIIYFILTIFTFRSTIASRQAL